MPVLKRRINCKMQQGKSCHVCKPGSKRGQNTSIQGQGKMSHLKPNAREQPGPRCFNGKADAQRHKCSYSKTMPPDGKT